MVPKDNQYMDGVPHVTQCPISPGAEFVYRFRASVPGTHFWHSHNSYQRGDGHFGPYVVRQPRSEDPLARLYDEDRTDHILFLQEFFHEPTREAFVKHHHNSGKNKADTLLINGRGQFKMFGSGNVTTPVAQFRVRPGRRYRFRVASPGFTLCPIVMSVDEHSLLMVASDGTPFRPIKVRSFVIHPGERYDFVLKANRKPSAYLLRAAGLLDCSNLKAHAVAEVIYESQRSGPVYRSGARSGELQNRERDYDTAANPQGVQLNAINYAPVKPGDEVPGLVPISWMEGFYTGKVREDARVALGQERADHVFYMATDLYALDNSKYHDPDLYPFEEGIGGNRIYAPLINNFSLKATASPLLSQESEIDPFDLCTSPRFMQKDCGGKDLCECLHIISVGLGDVVELVLIDEGFAFDVTHPFHLHGHGFFVVGMERHAANASHFGAKRFEGNSLPRDQVKLRL